MTGAEQRACPACGTLFTWTPAAPRQKFCSTLCRQRWWDRASRRERRERQAGDPRGRGDDHRRNDQHGPDDGRGDNHADHHDDAGSGSGQAPAAVAACPHCRKPVAIVAWLVPPAAASVHPPGTTTRRNGP